MNNDKTNLLLKKYYDSNEKLAVPFDAQRLFSDLDGGCGRDLLTVPERTREKMIKNAEKLLDKNIEALPASVYVQFARCGNRSNYEALQFGRRSDTITLLCAEFFEGKGRFSDKLADFVWATLEETTWVIPAHNPSNPGKADALTHSYAENVDFIDLFSAETASLMAWVWYLGKNILDAVSPIICERLLFELDRRIVKPFVQYDGMWWMGFDGRKVNNWNPWIVSNVLTVVLLTVGDIKTRELCVRRSMKMLDAFTSFYQSDGGCDEGPGYFSVAGESYFDCLELLYDLSGGKIDIFGEELVRAIGEYIAKVHICGDYFITFADSHAKNHVDVRTIIRFGRRAGSELLLGFGGAGLDEKALYQPIGYQLLYRSIKNSCAGYDMGGVKYTPMKRVWLDGIQIAAFRQTNDADKGLYLAMKGGNNSESHNHNDIGNFVVYSDGKPLFIDTGVGTYTRDTFGANRYKIFTMRSQYHNLPVIAGFDQKEGGQFAASDVSFGGTGGEASLSMQLKNAYPKEAGIVSYTRLGELDAEKIRISDKITLGKPSEIIFDLMTTVRPDISGHSAELGGRRVEFIASGTASEPQITLDVIKLDDDSLIHAWEQDELYRIRIGFAGAKDVTLETVII